VTANQPGPAAGKVASTVAPDATAAYAGLQESDVQDLYDAVGRLVDKQLAALRRLQQDAEGRSRAAAVEQQQLERFLDEVEYRIRFASEDAPGGATRPAATQETLRAQWTRLRERQGVLRAAQARLDHLSSRIGWLTQQIELSARRINEHAETPDQGDPWADLLRAQLIEGQEAERSRLAREIHDGPAQALTNALMRLQFLESVLAARPDEAPRELAVVRASVRDSLHDVRRFIFNLRPAALKDMGLAGTLHRMVREYREATGLEVDATLPESMNLTPAQELAVFRVVQEALQNVNKHAGASRVTVEVARRPNDWIVTVTDDGRGFESAANSRAEVSSGLVGIRERAAIIGASLDVASAPGQGTRLTLTIPTAEGPPSSP
jgi:two-component system, NarL family, sensor histidine kinase DegS